MALSLEIQSPGLVERRGNVHGGVTAPRPHTPVRLVRDNSPNTVHTEEAMSLAERLERTLKRALRELSERPATSAVELIGGIGGLFPGEAALLSGAGTARKDEFSAGRCCARRALAALGRQPVPLLMGPLGEPIWPLGFSGSISHDGRFAVALAYPSPTGRVRLSVDLIDPTDPDAFVGIADTICHPTEDRPSGWRAVARLFSAKEAAIKIISPAIGGLVDFRQLYAIQTDRGFSVMSKDVPFAIAVRTFDVGDLILSLACSA
jgi:4'-phosphopantetheinyl transferase EntD